MTRASKKTAAAKKTAEKDPTPAPPEGGKTGNGAGGRYAVYDHTHLRFVTPPGDYEAAETYLNMYDGGHKVTIVEV